MKKTFYYLFIILFVAGGIAIFATGQRDFSENENRYLNTFEKIKSTDDVEKTLADQFPMRDAWLGISSTAKYAFFQREINDALIGKDGYIFDSVSGEDFDSNGYENNLLFISTFAESYDADISLLLVPSPYTVLPEYLPANADVYDADEKFKQAAESFSSGNVQFFDLRKMLEELKKETQVYYRTDHHWTTTAAAYAYEYIGGGIDAKNTGLTPVTDSFRGTMYSRVLLPGSAYDEIYAYKPDELIGVYDEEKLGTKDKYAYFLGGNENRIDLAGSGSGRLLLFKDSFANCMIPFMLEDYEQITVIDLRFFNDSVPELMKEGFDRVLILYEISNFAGDKNLYKLAKV